jgi:hypothetical protein
MRVTKVQFLRSTPAPCKDAGAAMAFGDGLVAQWLIDAIEPVMVGRRLGEDNDA